MKNLKQNTPGLRPGVESEVSYLSCLMLLEEDGLEFSHFLHCAAAALLNYDLAGMGIGDSDTLKIVVIGCGGNMLC